MPPESADPYRTHRRDVHVECDGFAALIKRLVSILHPPCAMGGTHVLRSGCQSPNVCSFQDGFGVTMPYHREHRLSNHLGCQNMVGQKCA